MEAHKVILASSSPFFLKLLRKNKHPHPLIYMRGVKSEGLKAILDFLYFGEANIPQDYLDAFFVLASELEIEDMTEEIFTKQPPWKNVIKEEKLNISALPKSLENNSHLPDETKVDSPVDSTEAYESFENIGVLEKKEREKKHTAIEKGNKTLKFSMVRDFQDLDSKVKSMMIFSERILGGVYGNRRARICTICGKEGCRNDVIRHIESNHITGVSLACMFCAKIFRTRHTLKMHMSQSHKNLTK